MKYIFGRGKDNPFWKGDNVSYDALHRWIKRYKQKQQLCERCNKEKKLQLSNISGEYRREISDFEWLCSECHQKEHSRGELRNIKFKEYCREKGLKYNLKYKKTRERYYKKNREKILGKLREKRKDSVWRSHNLKKKKEWWEKNKEVVGKEKRERYERDKAYRDRLCEKVRKYRKEGYERKKRIAIVTIRKKYPNEFKQILSCMEGNYKKNYKKAEKIVKNNHREEFLKIIKGG